MTRPELGPPPEEIPPDGLPSLRTNRLLALLSPAELERLRPRLTTMFLALKTPLWKPDEPIEAVYFPTTGVASVLSLTTDGDAVEVGTIGNEGFVGLPVFLGAETSPGLAYSQVPGYAERMGVLEFRHEAERDGTLRHALRRYTQGFLVQVSQGMICNRAHTTDQRLARWLLMVRDRVGRNEFPITQEFLAQMLGVRRATVSETSAALQERGLIRYRRGTMTLTDPPGLERSACECYGIVRREFERLLGVATG
jgi:CRP-like cAMP-binding protein